MGSWQVAVELVDDPQTPVFRQIAGAIVADIERGRLRPGERLPSSRALSQQLGVNRNTVIAAYDELRAFGWIAGQPAKGMFVAPAGARSRPSRSVPSPDVAGFDLSPAEVPDPPPSRPPGLLLLLGGVPELRFLPHVELARAYRAALKGAGARRLVDYADPFGNERLRLALGDMLACLRGLPAPRESICVTRGGQGGIYLAANALLRPGDVVAVEELGYEPAWQALRLAGARLVSVPVDAHGLDVGALEARCAAERVRAVYLTPHHQYPTTVTLSPERRRRLLALAAAERMIVFEDDYDFDFHYDGRPVLPMASADAAGVVVYLGTMSKALAPGLRLGYVVATPDVARRIAGYRTYVDRQGDHVLERAVATLLEDGVLQHHARRAAFAYRARRDLLCRLLGEELPELRFRPPSGGMAVWAEAPGIDVDAWARRGLEAGVAFQAARRFDFECRSRPFVRIGFAACDPRELACATRRMREAVPRKDQRPLREGAPSTSRV